MCDPLGSDRHTRARRDPCPERCKTFAPSGERCLPRSGNIPFLGRVCLSHSSECAYPTRASVPVPLERVCVSHSSECVCPTRASRGALHERAEGLCTGEQWGFARASNGALHERAMGLCTSEQGVFARASRLAFLRGDLFIETKLKIIAYILGLIFTIQIYIATLIFARRAYGVIL